MKKGIALVLFNDDFRVKDQPALYNACNDYEKVLPLFIFDENLYGRKLGSAARVFLHQVLSSFTKELKSSCDLDLALAKGDTNRQLQKVIANNEIAAIYFNHSYSANQLQIEQKIKDDNKDLDVKSFKAKVMFEPWEIKTGSDEHFKVFTPFFKMCMKNTDLIGDALSIKKAKSAVKIDSLQLDDLNLVPKNEGDWPQRLIKYWQFDYKKLYQQTSDFLSSKLERYGNDRNMTDVEGTSNLSPYFRFGMISPRQVYHAAVNYKNYEKFVSEICWREFAYHVLYFYPDIATKEIREEYSAFEWEYNQEDFDKWRKGETGFDIVDAGMKEIYACGIMHNRVRMITASFLIKDLMIDWRKGEEYFWDCLVDADYAVNAFSWQWVFGSGFDAAPYFRVFNPILQQDKFDPKHKYCDKWLGNRIMTPQMVDHSQRRDIVLAKYKKCRS